MTGTEITDQLDAIADVEDFAIRSAELTERWTSAGAGLESVEPILRFMEKHPSIHYGMPGALVHFIERFYRTGYEEKLLESIKRMPTSTTVWMLNRVINGTNEPIARLPLIEAMKHSAQHSLADENAISMASRFLQRLGE